MSNNTIENANKVSSIINLAKINYIIWEEGYVFQTGEVLPAGKTGSQKVYDNSVPSEMILRIVFDHPENDIYCCREEALKVYDAYNSYLTEESKSYVKLGEFNYIYRE